MKEEQKYKPFNKEETADLQLTIDTIKQTRDVQSQELDKLESGFFELDNDIDLNLRNAKQQIKIAKLNYQFLAFDKKKNITYNRIKNKIHEIAKEIERQNHNITAFELELKKGKPILDTQHGGNKMSEEPKIEKTPEEVQNENKNVEPVAQEAPVESIDPVAEEPAVVEKAEEAPVDTETKEEAKAD